MIAVLALCALPSLAGAAWFDNAWAFRRQIDVDWPADKPGGGDELAWVDFYTAGHHKAGGDDIRVATEEGKLVASHVLMAGPGDRLSIVFALARNTHRYFVYFGNPAPAAPPKGMEDVTYRWGLLLESRRFAAFLPQNFLQMDEAWKRAADVMGRRMIEKLYLGVNPFSDSQQRISRVTGTVFAPVDGSYTFAVSAQQRAGLYIDGKPLVFAHANPGDTRFNAAIDLKRGKHDVKLYHANIEGDGRFTVVWKRPDQDKFELIPAESFGTPYKCLVGSMEENRKTLTSDFRAEYQAEMFYAYHYSHRYRFVAYPPKTGAQAKYEWNFGDGQTVSGSSADHVFLTDGEWPVTLTTSIGPNTDTQTTKIHVSRQHDLDHPPGDGPILQSKIVQTYDLAKMPPAYLPWATILHLRADMFDAAIATGDRLAATKTGVEVNFASEALRELTHELLVKQRAQPAVHAWELVPADSPLYARAVRQQAHLLLWRTGDLSRALKVLEEAVKAGKPDDALRRTYAQALILNQKADEGAKILQQLPNQGPPDRQAALSGALARTLEFYITEGDWETAEETWEKWQNQYPSDFLEGYSVLLKVRLMELYKAPDAAAKVAEAFALAVPKSTYAPTLLDQASKLLAKSDPQKSQALRQALKQKYPEDPLSQDKPEK